MLLMICDFFSRRIWTFLWSWRSHHAILQLNQYQLIYTVQTNILPLCNVVFAVHMLASVYQLRAVFRRFQQCYYNCYYQSFGYSYVSTNHYCRCCYKSKLHSLIFSRYDCQILNWERIWVSLFAPPDNNTCIGNHNHLSAILAVTSTVIPQLQENVY